MDAGRPNPGDRGRAGDAGAPPPAADTSGAEKGAVRAARLEDLEALVVLWRAFVGEQNRHLRWIRLTAANRAAVREHLALMIPHGQVLVLAEAGSDRPVGYASLAADLPALEPFYTACALAELYLEPAWRGGGWGRRLLDEVIAVARGHGVGAVSLRVFRTNDAARGLYRAAGFVPYQESWLLPLEPDPPRGRALRAGRAPAREQGRGDARRRGGAMTAPWLYVAPQALEGAGTTLEGESAHRVGRVWRKRAGEALVLCDGEGRVRRGLVGEVGRDRVEVTFSGPAELPPPPAVAVTVFQAVPKGDRLEWVLQKASELGAAELVPVLAARSIARPADTRLERWRAIAREAAEQCERASPMAVHAPPPRRPCPSPAARCCCCSTSGRAPRPCPGLLPSARPATIGDPGGAGGGLGPEEAAALRARGARAASLGDRILRTETASLAALAVVMAAYDW